MGSYADDKSGFAGSVTDDLRRAKLGDSYAQYKLWQRYVERLIRLARANLLGAKQPLSGPEDVALSVFNDLLIGLEDGQFRQLNDRNDLWQVLIMLTRREAIDELRRANAKKRLGCGAATNGNDGRSLPIEHMDWQDHMCSSDPTPEEAALLNEQLVMRINQLTDSIHRRIALAKMRGHNNQEIAEQLGISLRSVERKLSIIRRRWIER